ncbi:cysteine--tRNA ligase [Chloropicon primus]|uniref:cysteine--tRNA ligase n=1 Tax=Chloropicon primus TaxID=1764295 RepID=A0A5B8MJL9_9CHLO|nr:cysteine--tRNA ligase [Chloropicon primus]UPQ99096.1 cysteine--tRNA ligase [Chloropicon primus]|eukprot:QDZ19885.1 cysteine--tRNA ligase [Chloropicon primus]
MEGNGYCTWNPTADKATEEKLVVNNTLIRSGHVPFAPKEGNKVKWYTCGPTVYDVAHMGHARAYLTFDILRRILEDYFNYDVVYQMNITDIDDKIIVRARRTELLRKFREKAVSSVISTTDVGQRVLDAAEKTKEREEGKLEALKAELAKAVEVSKSSKESAILDTQVKEQELKVSQAQEALRNAQTAVAELNKSPKSGDLLEAVLEAAKDSLAESLDAEEGHTMGGSKDEDHKIFREHATKFEALFHEDMTNLGVRPPTILTRVSEYVPEVVAYIEGIVKKGFAYESNGSVYFDTYAFILAGNQYRKLEPMPQVQWESIKAGKGALEGEVSEKKSPMDFALWKKSKAGEPAWESSWGLGRPGWHIECSAMAGDVLGDNLDIHAGGEDLCFPHHDNELAQSEAYCGCKQWVNYFFHAGHLHIRGLKMSKSLKNFVTIRQALEAHTANQIRLLFLMQNWDKPMLYSDQMVDDAKSKEAMLRNFFGAVKGLLRETPPTKYAAVPQNWLEEEFSLNEELNKCKAAVHSSLCNNFDTPSAMEAIFALVSSTNKYINQPDKKGFRVMLLKSIALYITRILQVFGLLVDSDSIGFGGGGGGQEDAVEKYLDAFVHFRDQIRSLARDKGIKDLLELCDSVRDDVFTELGVRVEDSTREGQGSLWKLDDPAVLKKEIEEKKAKQREMAEKKRKNKLQKFQKELAKWEGIAAVAPEKLFLADEKYSKFDDGGLPVALANGDPLSKKQTKNCVKEMDKHRANYQQLQDKPGGAEAYLDQLRRDIEGLQI